MPLQLHSANEFGTLNVGAVKNLSSTLWGLDADVDKRAAYTVVRSGAGKTTNKIFSCSDYPSHNAAIQAAIDAANTAGGGAVRIEGGFFEIEDEIILKERVWLEGDGLGTRLQFKDGTTWTDKYMFRVDDFCSIRNIQLAGNIANVTGGSAIKIEGTACWFDRIRLYQFHQKGFYGVREAPTTQHPNGKPVHANQFTNLRITGCTEYGILMKDGTADNEYSNIWISNGNTGIRLESGQQEIANLHIWETDQNAMEIAASSSFVWLSNPYIESNKGWGCVIEGKSVTFNGGRIWKNGYDNESGPTGGIKIDGGSKVSVVGTHVHENRGPGIYLGGNANKWSAVGVQFYDPRAEGTGEPAAGDTTVRTQTYAVQCDNTVDYGTMVGCIALPWEHRGGTTMALGNHGKNFRASANFGLADTPNKTSSIATVGGSKAMYNVAHYPTHNAALEAALASSTRVHIEAGTYVMEAGVTLPANTVLTGEGRATRLQWKANVDHGGAYMLTVPGNSTVSDLTLFGMAGSANAGGIKVVGAYSILERLLVQDMTLNGIFVIGTSAITAHATKLNHIDVKQCADKGIYFYSYSYDAQMSNIWIGSCGEGMRLQEGQMMITNLHSWGNTGNGLSILRENVTVSNAYLETNGARGLSAYQAKHIAMTNVRFWKNGTAGANTGVNVEQCQDVRFSNCVFHDNNGPGLKIVASTDVSAITSKFYDSQATKTQTYAAEINSTSDYIVFLENSALASDHLTGAILDNLPQNANKRIKDNWV